MTSKSKLILYKAPDFRCFLVDFLDTTRIIKESQYLLPDSPTNPKGRWVVYLPSTGKIYPIPRPMRARYSQLQRPMIPLMDIYYNQEKRSEVYYKAVDGTLQPIETEQN